MRPKEWMVPVPAKSCVLYPDVQQPVYPLTHLQPGTKLCTVWDGRQVTTLKHAVQAEVTTIPPELHQPRAPTTAPARSNGKPPQQPSVPRYQPIAQRTRSHAPATRKPPVPEKGRPTQTTRQPTQRATIQRPPMPRFSNRTRKQVTVTIGNTEMQMCGAQMMHV